MRKIHVGIKTLGGIFSKHYLVIIVAQQLKELAVSVIEIRVFVVALTTREKSRIRGISSSINRIMSMY